MKNQNNVKMALQNAIQKALQKHVEKESLKTLDWFNASPDTTDFYIDLSKEKIVS